MNMKELEQIEETHQKFINRMPDCSWLLFVEKQLEGCSGVFGFIYDGYG